MLDDYELLYLAQENNEDATRELYKKYYSFICSKVAKYSSVADFDDYFNEAVLTFYNAIHSYKDKYKFTTYLNVCLNNRLNNYRISSMRKKRSIMNNLAAIEDIEGIIDSRNNPEQELLYEENIDHINKKIIKKLNFQEELVFLLSNYGFTPKEIALIIGKKVQAIYRYLENIKKKTSKVLITY